MSISTKKPVIGVIEWPYKNCDDGKVFEASKAVIAKISAHGGIPIGIFPTQIAEFVDTRMFDMPKLTDQEKDDIISVIEMCDGIIKPGANRIYEYERFIYDVCVERNIPFLGICAGMQLMANYGQESVQANVQNDPEGSIDHRSTKEYVHTVSVVNSNSKLFEILGGDPILVNSKHRFHVEQLYSPRHTVSALSEDGLIEAIEIFDLDFNIGIQWHPEFVNDEASYKIFDAFMKSLKK